MRRQWIVRAHPWIVHVGRTVGGAAIVISTDCMGFLPRHIIRLILCVRQRPIVCIILRINTTQEAWSVSTRRQRLHLVSPWSLAAHSAAIVLSCPAHSMPQSMILDWHSVPANRKRELTADVSDGC